MAISNADTALLGLLSEEPMHAWQIEKEVRERDMRFWTDLSQSTIYKQLRALEAGGLIDCREEIFDGRLRKIYSLTDRGAEEYRSRLRVLLSVPEHLKWRLDLATYNIDRLPKTEALDALAAYRAKLLETIKGYRDLEGFLVNSGCPEHRLALARRPVRLLEGEIAWLDDFVREVAAMPETDESPAADADSGAG